MQIFCTQTEQDTDQATKRSLAIDVCTCLKHQERRSLASLSVGSRRWNLWSLILCAQAWHTRSDVSDLPICRPISDFWNSLPLESIRGLEKGFFMRIFKFSEWDLEQTTTKSTIIVYSSLDSSFAAIYRANTTSDSFVLIIVSHSTGIRAGGSARLRGSFSRLRRFLCSRSNCLNRQATQAKQIEKRVRIQMEV